MRTLVRPLVIGHRGASGDRPEHTLASYALAARSGADGIEPDLVSTADGVLVARHEAELSATTDIARRPEFASRRTRREVDGAVHEGWFAEDLTLAEVRTLRAVERFPGLRPGSALHDRRWPVPTLADVLALRERLSAELGREIAVHAEVKHATHLAARGLAPEVPLVRALRAAGLDRPGSPVVVQSFETAVLRTVRAELDVPVVQLVAPDEVPADLAAAGDPRRCADLVAPSGLAEVASYATGVGAAKELVVPRTPGGGLGAPTSLVADAHAAGLAVHVWTFRDENAFLPPALRSSARPGQRGDAAAEYAAHVAAGVDGLITDHPVTAVAALSALLGAGAQTIRWSA